MWEIEGFTATYPYGTVTGTPAVGMYRNGPLRILYRDTSGTIQDLSGYRRQQLSCSLDGLAAGSNPSFGIDSNLQIYANPDRHPGLVSSSNTWNKGWSKVQWLTGPQGLTDGPTAAGQPAVAGGPHVFYRDADGNIHHVGFDGQKWTWEQVTGGAGLKAPTAAGDPKLTEFQRRILRLLPRHRRRHPDLQPWEEAKWSVKQITGGGQTSAPPTDR
jgi:hypothetical protein